LPWLVGCNFIPSTAINQLEMTNTIWPWGTEEGAPEPDPWFHDLFRQDGTPYREQEVALFRKLTKR
jgi:hypothetical protein